MAGLRDKYCIVGIGETSYSRNSGRSTRDLGTEAVRNAMADAGLHPWDVDGMLNYHVGDSTLSQTIATDLGIRLDFYTDTFGGGSSTETIIGIATGVIEAGLCHTVAVYRSMNGYSGLRQGGSPGTVRPPARVVVGPDLDTVPYGMTSPAQNFQLTFARHMYEYGTTSEQLAHVKVACSNHASNNPRAYYNKRLTVDDVLDSRWIVKPACHLLDCCIETDNATCIIVTSADRARHLRQRPISIKSVAGRVNKPFQGMYSHYQCDPDHQAGRVLRRPGGVPQCRGRARGHSTSPVAMTPSPLPPSCSSRATGSAIPARGASTCRAASSTWAGRDRTTPVAASCARATPTG